MMNADAGWVRLCAIALTVTLAVVPAFAILNIYRFDWYYSGGTGGESFAGNWTSAMDADQDEFWVAMYDATAPDAQQIHIFDAISGEWTKTFFPGPGGIPISTFNFISIEGNEVLTGGSGGAAIYDRSSDEWRARGLPTNVVYSATMKEGEHWFATHEGIGVLNSSGSWRYYMVEGGLPSNKVVDIVFDGSIAWVCTEEGVARFDTDSGEWRTYSEEDGLPGRVAETALKDGDYLWLAMKDGIGRINTRTGEVAAYAAEGDLVGAEWKDIAVLDDRIYFGSSKGISYLERGEDGCWKSIRLPKTAARKGKIANITHLATQGEYLWIALWGEGLVRMTIPKGLAMIPIWLWFVLLAGIGAGALLVIRPGAEKGEAAEKTKREKREQYKRREEAKEPPHELCHRVPKKEFCNRCNFNTVKAGELYCSKYKIPIEYKKESE